MDDDAPANANAMTDRLILPRGRGDASAGEQERAGPQLARHRRRPELVTTNGALVDGDLVAGSGGAPSCPIRGSRAPGHEEQVRGRRRRSLDSPSARCAALLQSPLTDSNRRPPPYHRATGREARAAPGSRGHASRARRRNRLKTNDRACPAVPGWCSLMADSCGTSTRSSTTLRAAPMCACTRSASRSTAAPRD